MQPTESILELIRSRTQIDFTGYNRSTLERRLRYRMAQLGIGTEQEYHGILRDDPAECRALSSALTVRVSALFRNPLVFDTLAAVVLPELIRRNASRREMRIWSAGCAEGEEPYSVAALVCEALGEELPRWNAVVFGTDLEPGAIEHARRGIYARAALADARLGLVDAYFRPCEGGFSVGPELRAMVRLSVDNLTSHDRLAPSDSVYAGFDLVLCRNVLIYFDAELQARILTKLARSLTPGGYLVLGDSEAAGTGTELIEVEPRTRIYQMAHPRRPT